MSENDLETLGLLVDKLDNFAAASALPLPPHIHVEALTSGIKDARDELRAFLISKGFNPWGSTDAG